MGPPKWAASLCKFLSACVCVFASVRVCVRASFNLSSAAFAVCRHFLRMAAPYSPEFSLTCPVLPTSAPLPPPPFGSCMGVCVGINYAGVSWQTSLPPPIERATQAAQTAPACHASTYASSFSCACAVLICETRLHTASLH